MVEIWTMIGVAVRHVLEVEKDQDWARAVDILRGAVTCTCHVNNVEVASNLMMVCISSFWPKRILKSWRRRWDTKPVTCRSLSDSVPGLPH